MPAVPEIKEKDLPVKPNMDFGIQLSDLPVQESVPELRQGEPPTVWQKLGDLFIDKETESARAVNALVDAERLGISPSSAYRLRDTIDRGVKINPIAAERVVPARQRINQSWEIGLKQNAAGLAWSQYLFSGDPKDFRAAESIKFPTEEEIFIPESFTEEIVRSAAKLTPMMLDTALEGGWKGIALGTGFGLITALGGQPELAPAMALAGFKIGGAAGLFESAMRKEAGLALMEIIQFKDEAGNQIDPDIARAASFGIGVINAGIEVAQVKLLLKTIPGADRIFSEAMIDTVTNKTVKQKLLSLAGAYSSTVAKETGQEIAQESVNVVFEEFSKNLNNRLKGTDIEPAKMTEIAERLRETAIESAQGFAVIALPGTVAQAGGMVLEAKPKQEVTVRQPLSEEVQPLAREVEEKGGVVLGEHEGSLVVANPETQEISSVNEDTKKKEIKALTEAKENQAISKLIESETDISEQSFDELIGQLEEGDITIEKKARTAKSILLEEKGSIDIAPLVDLGKSVWDEGLQTFQDFKTRMSDLLGKSWEKVKGLALKIWEMVRNFNERLGERGEIGRPDRETKGRIRELSGQIKDEELKNLNIALKKAEKVAREAYRAGNKEGFETAKAEIKSIKESVKARIRRITGQTKEKGQISEKEDLVEGLKKQEKVSKQAFKAGKEVGKAEALTPRQESVKERIRRITGITKEKANISERDALRGAFIKSAQAARQAFRVGNKEGMEKQKARMKEILDVMRERKELQKELKAIKRIKEKTEGRIALDYQQKIRDLLEGVDLTTPKQETIERLQGLKEFMEREGVPLGISQRALNQLQRLEKTPFREMSKDARKELLETAQKLYDIGKLKRELQLNKELRERNVKLDRLIQSTQNLDPQLSGEKRPTQTDTWKIGFTKLSMDTLHSFRQADVADGRNDYKGENAKMIKEQMRAEYSAKSETQRRTQSILDRIKKAGIDEISEEMGRRINVVLMAEQGARGQATALMNKYGLSQVPELTEQERRIVNIVRDVVGEKTNQIASVFERRENLKFPKVQNYFPIKYEREFNIAPSDTINQERYRTRKTEQGFTIERKPKVEKVPREDFLAVAEEAIFDQEWYIQMQPILDEHYSLVRTPEYKEAAGEMMWNWWKTQIDIVARKGWSATARANPILRQVRINLNQAILGFKLSSIVMQPFALLDAMAYATSHFGVDATAEIGKEFTKAWLNPIETMRFIETSQALKQRKAGEIAVEESLAQAKRMGAIRKAMTEYALKGLQTADVITAAGVQKGLQNILEKRGIENAQQEAEFLMNVVSSSAEVSMRPHILASGEMARTWFTFQTFFLNRWGVIYHDLIRTGMTGNWKRKLMSLAGLGILIAGGMGEDEARDLIYEFTTGRNSNIADEAFLQKVLLYLPRQIPIIGSLFEKWASAEPPAIRTLGKGATGTKQLIEGKPISGIEKVLESLLTLLVGMPGTAQVFDILGRFTEEPKEQERKKAGGARR